MKRQNIESDNEYQDIDWQKEKRKQRFKNKRKDKHKLDKDSGSKLFDDRYDERDEFYNDEN